MNGDATRDRDEVGKETHQTAIVIDSMGSWTMRRPTAQWDGMCFIDQALRAGLTAIGEAVVADTDVWDLRTVLRWFDDLHWMIKRFSDKALLVEKASDIVRAKREGKIGFFAIFQGSNAISEDRALLRIYHRLGLRSMGLTYMRGNALGSGCLEPQDNGLTYLGREAVREMNRVGVAVDLSHVGVRTSLDAMEVSRAPVVFTHSNVRALTPHMRNVTDEQLRALAQNGGVIGITPVSIFCRRGSNRPTLDDFIAHVDYAVQVAGVEHVGISTDRLIGDVLDEQLLLSKTAPDLFTFQLKGKHADGFDDFKCWPEVASRLLARGYSEEQVRSILGGNFLRVFGQIWGE